MDREELIKLATEVSKKAYTPYSKFQVGCVIVSESGNQYTGCNVENVSFGLTICAERAAVFKGISEEGPSFIISDVVIYTPTKMPTTPCGACRQVLSEFGGDFDILSVCDGDEKITLSFEQLLPKSPEIILKNK